MLFDALLKGGQVLIGGAPETVDIGVRDGLIVAIGRYLSSDRLCPVYDVRGKWVLPGLVDLWAAAGSGEEARSGGITLQCIHLAADAKQTLGETLRLAAEREAQSPVDHCFSYRVAAGQVPGKEALQVARGLGLCAVSFSLGARGLSDQEAAVLLHSARAAQVAAFCLLENFDYQLDAASATMLRRGDPTLPTPQGEALVAARAIALAEVTAMPIELLGVSQGAILRRVREAQKRGVAVRAHVFAHNLLAHRGVYLRRRGARLRPEPPLRTKILVRGLWSALANAGVVFCAAPRPVGALTLLEEPSAVAPPFAATAARVLLYRAQRRKKFSLARWVQGLAATPAAVLGFAGERAPIMIGALADLAVFDPSARQVLGPRRPKLAEEWEPFAGQRALPPPMLVMQRGRVLLDPQGVRKEVGEIARPLSAAQGA